MDLGGRLGDEVAVHAEVRPRVDRDLARRDEVDETIAGASMPKSSRRFAATLTASASLAGRCSSTHVTKRYAVDGKH